MSPDFAAVGAVPLQRQTYQEQVEISELLHSGRERGQWVVCYTSPQSFIITFSYSLA